MLDFPSRLCVRTLSLAAVLVPIAVAQNVYINSNLVTLGSGSTVMNARYRMSAANFDQRLSNNVPGGTNGLERNLGNVSDLSGDLFNFVLSHSATTGFRWELTNTTTGTTTKQYWGTTGTNSATEQFAATLGSSYTTGTAPNANPFNTLQLSVRASESSPSASSAVFSDFSFTGGTSSTGSFFAGTVTPTSGSGPGYSGQAADAAGFYRQWVYSDTNLASYDWSLSGKVTLTRTGAGDGEAVRFEIYGQNLSASVVPEPSFYASLALGFSGLVFAVRRRRQQR